MRNVWLVVLGIVITLLSTLAGFVSANRGGSFLLAAMTMNVLLILGVLLVGYIANELGLGE